MKDLTILFLFKKGREERLMDHSPDEFLYGFKYLQEKKYNVKMVTENMLDITTVSFFRKIINIPAYKIFGLPIASCYVFYKNFIKLSPSSETIVIATTNSFGIILGFLKALKLIKVKILFISMGLFDEITSPIKIYIYKKILESIEVVTLSYEDAKITGKYLHKRVSHVPFGVDINFWYAENYQTDVRYVLSIGNDRHRDYHTLLESWKSSYPLLKIITNTPLKSSKNNIEIIKGSWSEIILSDENIRHLINGADYIVLPISNTIQPSGQSAALQAMSCAKTVLITDYPGLWNRELMINKDSCIFMGLPGSIKGIQDAIDWIEINIEEKERIGIKAREIISRKLNSYETAMNIESRILKIHSK